MRDGKGVPVGNSKLMPQSFTVTRKADGFAMLAALEDFIVAMNNRPDEIRSMPPGKRRERVYHGARVVSVGRLRDALRVAVGL